jgi:RimJ/RimL family protein N-acetyltransferase
MPPDWIATVDTYWAGIFGCAADTLWPRAPTVTAHRAELVGYRGIYVLAHRGAVRVSAPSPLVDELAELLDDPPGALVEPATWNAMLGERAAAVQGPSAHHYLDAVGAWPTAVREVSYRQLDPLAAACPEAEWREGGFGDGSARYFGCWVAGELVAAGNLTQWRGRPSDVGLITHPAHRGRGYARRVAAHTSRVAIENAGVARYRALISNTPSIRLARSLGYVEYGRNLAIRLP